MQRSSSDHNVAEECRVSATGSDDLIASLFTDLHHALDMMIASARSGADDGLVQYRARATSILAALDEKLNFEVAGELAQTLRIIYAEAAKRIQLETSELCVERVESAREMIGEIEKTWNGIVPDNSNL